MASVTAECKVARRPTLIANDFYNVGWALGAEIADWRTLDLAALADLRADQGQPLKAGEFVTLGSITRFHPVAAGDRVEIEIHRLAAVSIRIG